MHFLLMFIQPGIHQPACSSSQSLSTVEKSVFFPWFTGGTVPSSGSDQSGSINLCWFTPVEDLISALQQELAIINPATRKRWKLHWGSFCNGPFSFWPNLCKTQIDVLRSHLQDKIFLGVSGICKIYNSLTKLFDTMSQKWLTCLCLAWEKTSHSSKCY